MNSATNRKIGIWLATAMTVVALVVWTQGSATESIDFAEPLHVESLVDSERVDDGFDKRVNEVFGTESLPAARIASEQVSTEPVTNQFVGHEIAEIGVPTAQPLFEVGHSVENGHVSIENQAKIRARTASEGILPVDTNSSLARASGLYREKTATSKMAQPSAKRPKVQTVQPANFEAQTERTTDNSFRPLSQVSQTANARESSVASMPMREATVSAPVQRIPVVQPAEQNDESLWQPQTGQSNSRSLHQVERIATSDFGQFTPATNTSPANPEPLVSRPAPNDETQFRALPTEGLAVTNHEADQPHDTEVNTAAFFTVAAPPQGSGPSQSTQGTTSYRLAGQPELGAHYKSEIPLIDRNAAQLEAEHVEDLLLDFSPDPIIEEYPYDPVTNQSIYQCKTLNANQRPLLELGRPWYQLGQLPEGSSLLGFHNNVNPQFLIFGDYRQAIASNTIGGDSNSLMSVELNTIWNLFITSTERVVWGVAPFDNGAANTRWEFDNDRVEFETDFDFDFGYLEGDLGAIVGGFQGETLPFDAPFAIGLTPILIQNGVWLNDAVEGFFYTVPARNSARLGISNMDISFGFIWDEINSDAFPGDKNAAKAYMIYSFIEALNGYLEIDYAFLEDRTAIDRSYHNIGLAYSRRFGNFISHSTRVIANAGQEVAVGNQTADGVLLLFENSLITSNPYTVIPYFNTFAGFDTPQTVAGNQKLVNTGILFESDGMTGYPTLDATANDTFGGAIGLNLLAQDFSQQLILEAACVFRGDDSTLAGDQYGLGMRYQIPLSNSWIFRTDSMVGFFRGTEDSAGVRMELRKKF